jgi:hypothetical protein
MRIKALPLGWRHHFRHYSESQSKLASEEEIERIIVETAVSIAVTIRPLSSQKFTKLFGLDYS